jgi:ubiquinone/menaquinone biosynthesis C-methylase UbiE/uncharacterized protein YbaR (Trm112 family)
MNHFEFLELLICPISKEKLCLHSFELIEEKKVKFGVLISKSGYTYPIINYIPRIFEGAWLFYKDKLNDFQNKIIELEIDSELNKPSEDFNKNVLPTLKRFQKEWEKHVVSGKTWGWSQSDRIKKYREYMQLNENTYENKLFLDIGAGTGQLTLTLSKELKGTFIGVDLTPGIEKGNEIAQNNESVNCFFVQASLMQLPFKEQLFDYIHASGVLHHTPSTQFAFKMVEKHTKVNGKFGAWLYRKGNEDIHLPLIPIIKNPSFLIIKGYQIRKYTTKLNPGLLYNLIFCYCTYFQFFYRLSQIIKGKEHHQTIKERTTSIFDALAPTFAHKHTPEEVQNWFTNHNYSSLVMTDKDKRNGFNIVGTKQP